MRTRILIVGMGLAWVAGAGALAQTQVEIERIFAEAEAQMIPDGPEMDRDRGTMVFEAADAEYDKGGHFGRWMWPEFTGERWGNYEVEITCVSIAPKMGFQFYIGKAQAKGYVGQSGGMEIERTAVLDTIYLADTGPHPVGALTGDDTNGPGFKLKRITLRPTSEGEAVVNQGIDGIVMLAAKDAATFSTKMRYEPAPEKDCLGFWTDPADWAEWRFEVHDAGMFEAELYYGCGGGNHGSEVRVWINDQEVDFTVADTGGFQSWQGMPLGSIELKEGEHRVVVQPQTQAGKGILDVQKVVFTPVGTGE